MDPYCHRRHGALYQDLSKVSLRDLVRHPDLISIQKWRFLHFHKSRFSSFTAVTGVQFHPKTFGEFIFGRDVHEAPPRALVLVAQWPGWLHGCREGYWRSENTRLGHAMPRPMPAPTASKGSLWTDSLLCRPPGQRPIQIETHNGSRLFKYFKEPSAPEIEDIRTSQNKSQEPVCLLNILQIYVVIHLNQHVFVQFMFKGLRPFPKLSIHKMSMACSLRSPMRAELGPPVGLRWVDTHGIP